MATDVIVNSAAVWLPCKSAWYLYLSPVSVTGNAFSHVCVCLYVCLSVTFVL